MKRNFLLWFDSDRKPIASKIMDARARFVEKFGGAPTVAFVSPSDFRDDIVIDGLTVRKKSNVMQHHIWLLQ